MVAPNSREREEGSGGRPTLATHRHFPLTATPWPATVLSYDAKGSKAQVGKQSPPPPTVRSLLTANPSPTEVLSYDALPRPPRSRAMTRREAKTPEWTIADLVEHVGQTQHWVAEIIERRITDPTQLPTEMAVLPNDPREWQAWLSESAHRVASACSDDALDAPVFNAAGTGGPGRDSGCPASSTRRSSTASTQPTRRTDRPTLTPTSASTATPTSPSTGSTTPPMSPTYRPSDVAQNPLQTRSSGRPRTQYRSRRRYS